MENEFEKQQEKEIKLSPAQVYQDVLLLDKSITLEFINEESFKNFRSALYVARYRMKVQVKALGFGDVEDEDISIATKVISKCNTYGTLQVIFYNKPKTQTYKILSIKDNTE